jgi:uncharacterized membrane protein YhaH (DUF805 family)
MEWYLKVLKQYADFSGRARRKEYWMFYLIHVLILLGFVGLFTAFLGNGDGPVSAFMILYGIYVLGTFIPTLAVTVRRLHDTGKSGAMILVTLIPFIGGIWLFILMVTEGEYGENGYGPDPKGEEI